MSEAASLVRSDHRVTTPQRGRAKLMATEVHALSPLGLETRPKRPWLAGG